MPVFSPILCTNGIQLFTIANAIVYIFGEIYFSIMSASILIYINSANQSGNGRHMSTLTVDELDSLFKVCILYCISFRCRGGFLARIS